MMKNWKKIAALFVVLVVFVVAFILLNMNKDKLGMPNETASPAATSTTDEIKPVDVARDQIAKIILSRESEDIVLTKIEKEIEKLEQKEDGTTEKVKEKVKVWETNDFDVDSTKVDDIALAAETVTTKRLIDENPEDIAIFGLDDALVTTIVSVDGKEFSLEIGDKIPTGDGYYFRKSGSASVYTIDSYKGDKLRFGKLDIMSKALYGSEALMLEDITSLALTKDGSEVFVAKKDTASPDWYITSPLKHKADINDLSKFLSWLVNLRVKEYEAENHSDLKTYGLDKPKYVFDYTLEDKAYSLKLSALKDDICYAQLEGNPSVFTLDTSKLTFIDMTLFDVTDIFIYIPNIRDVEKLVIEMDGRVDELLIKADSDVPESEEFVFNGKRIEEDDKSAFRGYYQGAISMRGTKLDLNAVPSGKAEIRLTYTMEKAGHDGKVVVVELIPSPDGYGYYLMKNGSYSGLVMSGRLLDETDMIREMYKVLIEALK